ncbi:ABC transporter permease subunit [Defluviimonas sp. WL0024]|uniref:ABC transporter permease subunit n=1 Tax=Albidovulum salinarum TaxID=2984153 RepID=A0ABT2X4T3_9RHOB|nr:ABC transporter permease subunit [Defluviimonas sp. WL0024]MCU9848364.1 ABC transporter permease subunit [Defluviimonas sp. WL0024]
MRIDLIAENADLFVTGISMTLKLTVMSLAIGMAIALPVAVLRGMRLPVVDKVLRGYIFAFRGTPMLVQTYLIYYGLAQFEFVRDSVFWAVLKSPFNCALIAFSLNTAAYTAEILRGALEATPKGEIEAAEAIGLSPLQVLRRITIPGAFRRALPQYGNEVILMLHGSTVASVITIQDILGAGRTLNGKYYLAYEGLVTAALLYLALTLLIAAAFGLGGRKWLAHLRPAATR